MTIKHFLPNLGETSAFRDVVLVPSHCCWARARWWRVEGGRCGVQPSLGHSGSWPGTCRVRSGALVSALWVPFPLPQLLGLGKGLEQNTFPASEPQRVDRGHTRGSPWKTCNLDARDGLRPTNLFCLLARMSSCFWEYKYLGKKAQSLLWSALCRHVWDKPRRLEACSWDPPCLDLECAVDQVAIHSCWSVMLTSIGNDHKEGGNQKESVSGVCMLTTEIC